MVIASSVTRLGLRNCRKTNLMTLIMYFIALSLVSHWLYGCIHRPRSASSLLRIREILFCRRRWIDCSLIGGSVSKECLRFEIPVNIGREQQTAYIGVFRSAASRIAENRDKFGWWSTPERQQFLCSVSLYSAWLPCGGSCVAKGEASHESYTQETPTAYTFGIAVTSLFCVRPAQAGNRIVTTRKANPIPLRCTKYRLLLSNTSLLWSNKP